MTDKSKSYTLTQAHFDRVRADIARRRADIDSKQAQLEADEQAFAQIVERYSDGTASPAASPAATKAKAPRSGKPYTPYENAQIDAAKHDDLKQLADDMGRDYPNLLKHREERRLRKARNSSPEELSVVAQDLTTVPTVVPTPPPEPAPVAPKMAPMGSAVIDNGPGDRRYLDPIAFASKRSV